MAEDIAYRELNMNTIITRCTRCVLPETYPNIKFDHNGVCNVCIDFDQKWSSWKDGGSINTQNKLTKICNNVKKLKLKYDCLVPFSGGKDSAYVLYLCKNIYKLNPLAFNLNNGFQTEGAIKNIFHAVKLLDVDLVTISPRWSLMKELDRSFLLTAGETCTPCNIGIQLGSYKIAQQERIPLIVMGSSPRTEECSPKEIYTCNNKYFMNVINRNNLGNSIKGTLYEDIYKKPSFIDRKLQNMSQKYFGKMDSLRVTSLINFPLYINLPEYIEWNENEIFDLLKGKLRWEESNFGKEHMDCEISPVKGYLRYLRWGFGSKTQKYAALVRDGQLSRDAALELIKEEGKEPKESFDMLFNKLDLTPSCLEDIMKSYHMDYVN
jgi:N-acetyl sugar amidotransferase